LGNIYCGFFIFTKMVACGEHVLPEEAAPGLSFEEAARLLPIYEVYGDPDWSEADIERLAGYRMIGSDGAGNPICIVQGTGAVVLLDHEDWFRTRQFVNSSVRQLAECVRHTCARMTRRGSGRQCRPSTQPRWLRSRSGGMRRPVSETN
jgi:hypothetical protein